MFLFELDYLISDPIAELSPLEESHIAPLYEEANDKDIWKHFLEKPLGKESFSNYVLEAIAKREAGIEYPFVIKDLRSEKYAGITRVYAVSNDLKNVKIGHTWIGKQFQGTGLNKCCKYLLFELLFDQLKIQRIGFGASAENTISIQAMKSLGCQQEGVLRSFMPSAKGDKRVDIVLLSLLFEEWDATVRAELGQKVKALYS